MEFLSNPKPKKQGINTSFSHKAILAASPISSFKNSVNKNPSYFAMTRNPEMLNENKRLKEENWKLKQQIAGQSDEISKLKSKLSHKIDLKQGENSQAQNQGKYIDTLQESLRSIRTELKKSKQEIVELRKRLYSNKPAIQDTTNFAFNRFSSYSTEQLIQESEKLKMPEFSKAISYLRSEIKILQDEKRVLEKQTLKPKKAVLKIEQVLDLGIGFDESKSVDQASEFLAVPRKLKKKEFSGLDQFFRDFIREVKNKKGFFEELSEGTELDELLALCRKFEVRVDESELRQVFSELKNRKFEENDFLANLKKYLDEDSGHSSDISSVGEASETEPSPQKESNIGMIFDNIAFMFNQLEMSKEEFLSIFQENLNETVSFSELVGFFERFPYFIKDKSDRIMVVINIFEGFEYKLKNDIIQRCLKDFFKYSENYKVDSGKINEILVKVNEKSGVLLEKFKENSSLDLDFISWEILSNLIHSEGCLNFKDFQEFKIYAFSLSKNLKKIPYKLLFFNNI